MSKLQEKRIKHIMIIFILVLIGSLVVYGATGQDETKTSGKAFWALTKIVAIFIIGAIIAISIIWRAINRSKYLTLHHPPTPYDFIDSYFYRPTSINILENLRSMKREKLRLALEQIANCPVYEEELINEITKIIGKQSPYDQLTWLNIFQRCRYCRFLHLILERNKASESGKRFDNGINFDEIFYSSQSSYCAIRGSRRNFIESLIYEIRKIIFRKAEDNND